MKFVLPVLCKKLMGVRKKALMEWHQEELLNKVPNLANEMATDKQKCWNETLRPALSKSGITFKNISQLSKGNYLA